MSEVKPTPAPPKEKVKFLWNDKEIEAKPGSNLLKAALDNKIDVAHYCYHPGLSIAGVCRMCMVEQEGVPRPFPACNATVSEGIKVRNDSAQIKAAVEWTLQLHLVNHPLDCPICDQAGECGLQDYYMKHGVYDSSMIDKKVHKDKVQDIGNL
jgi:NADH-quinone oxidoreductase subunit G